MAEGGLKVLDLVFEGEGFEGLDPTTSLGTHCLGYNSLTTKQGTPKKLPKACKRSTLQPSILNPKVRA